MRCHLRRTAMAFSSNVTITESLSYVATTTYTIPVSGSTCTAEVQEAGIWTAK